MLCINPKLIRNKYTKKWLFVPCNNCDACRIQGSITKTQRLNNELSNFGISTFITLTYENQYIPFIVNGSRFLCRGSGVESNLSVELLERYDYPFTVNKSYPVNGSFPFVNSDINYMTVLYKRDYQLLLKLIRKHGQIRFKYFVAGEYGTFSHRCHFHFIFRTNKESDCRTIERLVTEYWKLCDWNIIKDYAIQRCGKGVGSYLSSYVNSCFGDNEFFLPRCFKAFTRRSNQFDYGFDNKDIEKIKGIIKREFGKGIFNFSESDFTIREGISPNTFSSRYISTDIFVAYFPKIKGYSYLSYIDFRLCCYRIFRISKYKDRFGRFPDFEEELSSLDLTFFRAYRRICYLFDFEVYDFENFEKYVELHYKITAYFNALYLKVQMLEFEEMTVLDYIKTQYNTFSNDPPYYKVKSIYRQFGIIKIPESHSFHTNKKTSRINEIIRTNHYKLLPKHINNLINHQNNLNL